MAELRIYKGIDLLEKVLEFVALTPSSNEWHLLSLKSNKPRFIRLQQIQSLIDAFFEQNPNKPFYDKVLHFYNSDKVVSIETLLTGEFIKHKKVDDYERMMDFVLQLPEYDELFVKKDIKIYQLAHVYKRLLSYKQHLRSLIGFNSGVLEASSISYFPIFLTERISSNLVGKYEDLNVVLELLINPKRLSFTEDELIAKYGFPNVKIEEIDFGFL